MNKFLTFLIVLAAALAGVYFLGPQEKIDQFLGLEKSSKKVSKKKGKKKARTEKPAPPVSAPAVTEVREQAKAENKPFVILWHGSDWMGNSDSMRRAWHELTTSKPELPVIFGQFDEVDKLPEEARQAAAMPIGGFNLPIVVLFAPDGTFMASYSGKAARSASTMEKGIKKTLAKMDAFMELVKKARESQGEESVVAAGKALEMLTHKDAWQHRELTKIIGDRDPKDMTGYRSKFCLEHMGMYKLINDTLKGGPEGSLSGNDRKFAEAEQYVKDVLSRNGGAQPALHIEQQQQWLAGLYYIQKERAMGTEAKDRTEMLATLERIIKLDPESEYGVGAAGYHRYWDPKSFFTVEDCFYESKHQTLGFDKDWHVDITRHVQGPGTYTITLVPQMNGRLDTRNFRIAVNGKEVSQADIDPTTVTKTVDIRIPNAPKGAKVELYLTARCHDHWLSCSGRIEVTKK